MARINSNPARNGRLFLSGQMIGAFITPFQHIGHCHKAECLQACNRSVGKAASFVEGL